MTCQPSPARRLRVVEVSSLAAGGVRAHLGDCARMLAGMGHDVVVAAPAMVLTGLDVGTARAERLEIGPRPWVSDVAVLVGLRRLGEGAHVVHAHGLRAGGLTALALGSRRPGRARLVVTLHNLPVGSRLVRALGCLLEGLVAARADLVLAVSPDLAERAVRRGARAVELAVVPAPQEPGAHTSASSSPSPAPVAAWNGRHRRILTVARLAPQKGLSLLLDTAAVLSRRVAEGEVPEFTWWVAGDGPGRAGAQDRIDAEQLPVRLLGRSGTVPALMAQADVVVQTSLWEGQPLTVQEALRAQAAVVATDVGGTAMTARGGAVLVPPRAQEMAEAVGALLADPHARERARQQARAAACLLPTGSDLRSQLCRVLTR